MLWLPLLSLCHSLTWSHHCRLLSRFSILYALLRWWSARDNINNYVRNLCSGDYLAAFSQFFLFHFICLYALRCFVSTMLRFMHVSLCVCVSMPKCTGEVHRIDGHYSLCHSLLATIIHRTREAKKTRHESDKKHCVLFTWRWTFISIDLMR